LGLRRARRTAEGTLSGCSQAGTQRTGSLECSSLLWRPGGDLPVPWSVLSQSESAQCVVSSWALGSTSRGNLAGAREHFRHHLSHGSRALLREPGRLQARWASPIRVHGREAAEGSRCVGGSPAGGVLTRTGPQALFLQAPQRQEPERGLGPGSTAPGPRS
jgi:hypothetical protein